MGYIYTVLLGHPLKNICLASIEKSSYKPKLKLFLYIIIYIYRRVDRRYIYIYIYIQLQLAAYGQIVLVYYFMP